MKKRKYPFLIEITGSPEAGKTTCIKELERRFLEANIKAKVIRESAEIISEETLIPKTSVEAHISMRMLTAFELFKAKYEDYDIIIADRGIIDGIFFTLKVLISNPEYYDECSALIRLLDSFKKFISPDLLVILTVNSTEAIKRKGHEGTIVNYKFVEEYNKLLSSFIKTIDSPYFLFDSSGRSQEDTANAVFEEIMKMLK